MLRVLIVAALFMAGCKADPHEGEIRRIRDEELGVTCWIYVTSGSISCVRDAK